MLGLGATGTILLGVVYVVLLIAVVRYFTRGD